MREPHFQVITKFTGRIIAAIEAGDDAAAAAAIIEARRAGVRVGNGRIERFWTKPVGTIIIARQVFETDWSPERVAKAAGR